MNEPAAGSESQDLARRLRRRTWILIGLSFALMVGAGGALKIAPDLVSDTLSKLFGAAVAIGILAYFVVGGEPEYRKARASSIAAWLILLGVAPVLFVAQRLDQGREVEKIQAVVAAMADRYAQADRDYADKLKPQIETALAVLGSDGIADAAARGGARAKLAAAIKTIDDALALRERIPEETIAQVQATAADSKAKEATVAGIRTATAGPPPLSVQIMKGTRAFLVKAGEVIAHVDQYAAGVTLRDGQLEFADDSAAGPYKALQSELAGLGQELQRLKQQTQKPASAK
jgi:hypothetical protein